MRGSVCRLRWEKLGAHRLRRTLAILISLLTVPHAYTQSSATDPLAFVVASIKPSSLWKGDGEGSHRSKIEHTPISLSMGNVSLRDCVQWAYNLKSFQVDGSGAIDSDRYDILAKAAEPVSETQLRSTLQGLLAERFKLTVRHETRATPVYDLIIAKGGPKLPAAKPQSGDSLPHAVESLPRVQNGNFVFQDTTMSEFAEKLSLLRGIDLPVIDKTEIGGVFDITLQSAAAAILQSNGPSLFTLLEEQLGLKLVSKKEPMQTLVVTHGEKPSEN